MKILIFKDKIVVDGGEFRDRFFVATLVSAMFNPYKYYDYYPPKTEKLPQEVDGIDGTKIKTEVEIWKVSEKREKDIRRLIELHDKQRSPVFQKILLSYGKWGVLTVKGKVIKGSNNTVKVELLQEYDVFLLRDSLSTEIYSVLLKRDKIDNVKIKTFGDVMMPVYYRKVKNEKDWILSHTDDIISKKIEESLKYENTYNIITDRIILMPTLYLDESGLEEYQTMLMSMLLQHEEDEMGKLLRKHLYNIISSEGVNNV